MLMYTDLKMAVNSLLQESLQERIGQSNRSTMSPSHFLLVSELTMK